MDPIADLLVRIKNAYAARKAQVAIPASREKQTLAQILAKSGYISQMTLTGEGKERQLLVTLKYVNQVPAITEIKRVSKPGRRVYRRVTELPRVLQGQGMAIVSTSKGLMTDQQARKEKLGGEVIATVW
jgi:small subunit ribosomal protein S8